MHMTPSNLLHTSKWTMIYTNKIALISQSVLNQCLMCSHRCAFVGSRCAEAGARFQRNRCGQQRFQRNPTVGLQRQISGAILLSIGLVSDTLLMTIFHTTRSDNIFCFAYSSHSTFVCPTEIIAFSDRIDEFKALNTEVVGVSVDSQFSHLAWCNTDRKVNHSWSC